MGKAKICPILSMAGKQTPCIGQECAWAFKDVVHSKQVMELPPACSLLVIAAQLDALHDTMMQAGNPDVVNYRMKRAVE